MSLWLKMGFRNLFRHKRRSLFTGLSIVTGFALCSFFIGWAEGSYNQIIDGFTRYRTGHIQIHARGYVDDPSFYKTFDLTPGRAGILDADPHILGWSPRITTGALFASDSASSGGELKAFDPGREAETTQFQRHIVKGRIFKKGAQEVVLGKELAGVLKVSPGDHIIVVTQAADGITASGRYRVSGLSDTGEKSVDRVTAVIPLSQGKELLWMGERIHEIAVTVDRMKSVEAVKQRLKRELADSGLDIQSWQEFNPEFYRAMMADKRGNYILLLIMVIIVAVGVFNTVLMAVMERQHEYGLMRALGTSPGGVFALVVSETGCLVAMASFTGMLLGMGLNWYFHVHGLTLPQPLSYGGITFESLHSEIVLKSVVLPWATVLVSAFTVTLYPAIQAARVAPARVMRSF